MLSFLGSINLLTRDLLNYSTRDRSTREHLITKGQRRKHVCVNAIGEIFEGPKEGGLFINLKS